MGHQDRIAVELLFVGALLFPKEQANGHATEIITFPEPVLQKPLVWLLNVLWKIAIECKRWNLRRQLRNVLNAHTFPLVNGWWLILYNWQEFIIQFRSRNLQATLMIYVNCSFQRLKNPLLRKVRSENNRNV